MLNGVGYSYDVYRPARRWELKFIWSGFVVRAPLNTRLLHTHVVGDA